MTTDNKAALDALDRTLHRLAHLAREWDMQCSYIGSVEDIKTIRQALTAPAVDVEIESFEICKEGTTIPIVVEGETRFIKEVDFQKYKAARGLIGNAPQWQSMESAPKDGTEILLYGGDWVFHARWENDRWFHAYKNQDEPTHWMPLPQPPKGGEE